MSRAGNWFKVAGATLAMVAMAVAQAPAPAGNAGGGRQGGGPGGGNAMARGAQRNPDAIVSILDLSDRQYLELTELRTAHLDKLNEYSDEQRSLAQEQRTILASSGADPSKIGSITLRQQALTQMIQQENDAFHTAALALLTATQRDKVTAIEEALKLAPNAPTLMQFGLLDSSALGNRRGFMGMAPGQPFRAPGGPPPQN